MVGQRHRSETELAAGLAEIRASPKDEGVIRLIVRRPGRGQRETVREARLDLVEGLVGDSWKSRGSSRRPDGSADPEAQLTLMNARVIALLAGGEERWSLAGDQLFVDLDLSVENLPAGSRLSLGAAVVEVSASPHTGCGKFSEWFGPAAARFVNSPEGKALRLRGLNARIVTGGRAAVGDAVRKV